MSAIAKVDVLTNKKKDGPRTGSRMRLMVEETVQWLTGSGAATSLPVLDECTEGPLNVMVALAECPGVEARRVIEYVVWVISRRIARRSFARMGPLGIRECAAGVESAGEESQLPNSNEIQTSFQLD
jgi:hypothetical protein